ncbi:ABC transporter ATP-binding protein [Pseudoclavibacter chungangensis]|uniref:ABC transporter ATP-binding protein n=1 Tax=Pseudoclavibacter chungangensis TaxID=587635 RepID=A0A7J5BN49_9MICO|nr:ABC transporter ATP-binding protein [Pseudoclavibacter chungangensis]NYJ67022.1 ABC-type lipoprotein export system ATPase subunit [Pseudoclavibacter chungangensis]
MGLIELRDVHKSVRTPDGGDLHILKGIDLRVDRGEHVSVVGRSGSGKSTLLNIIGLLDTASTGDVLFNDTPTTSLSAVRRDRLRGSTVGFVFQQFNLLQKRTAVENVAMPLLYERDERFWKRKRIASEMLERVGLGHRLDAKPDRLSGGEQQRVAIARALVRRPALILADEPTGALDVETGAAVMALLDEVTSETDASMIVITHDPAIAAQAPRVIRIDDGHVLADDDLTEAERERIVARGGEVPVAVGAVAIAKDDVAAPEFARHVAAQSVFVEAGSNADGSSPSGVEWDAVTGEPEPDPVVFDAPEVPTFGASPGDPSGDTVAGGPVVGDGASEAPNRRGRRRSATRRWRRGRSDEASGDER